MADAFIPRPWQPPMLDHLASRDRCAVFANMGSGKTVATLTSVQDADLLGEGPVLVLAPRRVALNTWPGEVKKWSHLSHLRISPAIGSADERQTALARRAEIYTCNYDNLPWLVKQYGNDWPYRTVIADELTRLKSYRTVQGGARARALSAVVHRYVDRFIGLTGTPAPNGYKDLWGQLWFVDRGERLGRTYNSFLQRWFRLKHGSDSRHGQYEPMPHAEEEINERIKDICITIDPTDYGMKLDDPIDNVIEVDMPTKAMNMYRQLEREFFTEIAGVEIDAVNAGAKSLKLLQLASGALYTDEDGSYAVAHDAKIEALQSIVEEASGMPVLVAYHFKSDLARLKKAFPMGRELDQNPKTEEEWNAGKIPIMFAHPASAGHGLNLQYGGNIIAYFSHWWDLETHEQILERIGPLRQYQSGLDRPVYRHFITARGTIDNDVLLRHETKRSVQQILLEAMKRRS